MVRRSLWLLSGILGLRTIGAVCLVSALLVPTAAPLAQAAEGAVRILTVKEGDSWYSIRDTLYPIETLKQSNPKVAAKVLVPGDKIRSAFVPISQLDALRALQADSRKELAEAVATVERQRVQALLDQDQLKKRSAELALGELELAGLRSAAGSQESIVSAVKGAAILLSLLLAVALQWSFSNRRTAAGYKERFEAEEGRYADLRGSLDDIERDLQRRLIRLLTAHHVRIVSSKELTETSQPTFRLARDLKHRHTQGSDRAASSMADSPDRLRSGRRSQPIATGGR